MKKLSLTVFTVICALCFAFGAMLLMINTSKTNAENSASSTPVFSATKVMVSNAQDKMLLVTAIKDYGDVYEVGYTFTGEITPTIAENGKYYTSITSGTTTLKPDDIFNEEWVANEGVGMVIWEIPFSAGTSYEYKVYALVGERNNNNELVLPETEIRITPENMLTKIFYTVSVEVGQEGYGSLSKTSVLVPSGTAISAVGNILTVGGIEITATAASATAQYTYTFDMFDYDADVVSGNMTIGANFTRTVNEYTITFKNYDGTVLQSGKVAYGATPVYSGAVPTKPADVQYTYTFDTWDKAIVAATGAATYTATFSVAETEYTQGVLTLNSANITEIKTEGVITGFSGTYDYRGLGNYSVGDVLEFRFTGKNIPNVALFTDKNWVNPVGGGTANTGIFVQTSGHGTDTFLNRTYIAGPFLLDAGSVEPYRTLAGRENYEYKGELGKNIELGVDISNTGNTSLFGINLLDENTEYIYRVSSVASGTVGKVIINLALYSVEGQQVKSVAKYTKEITHYLASLDNRFAAVYGAGDRYGNAITFSYQVKPDYDITPSEGTLTLTPASITEIKTGGVVTGFNGTYDYVGLGSYNVGDVLEFRFTGKNIPNVAIFANENGVNPLGGGTENTGIFLQTSGHGTATFINRMYISGPFLLDAGSVDAYKTVYGESYEYKPELGKNKELGVKTTSFGINLLDPETDYLFKVWTVAHADASSVTIKTAIYSVEGDTETLIEEYSRDVVHALDSLLNRYAVVYGAGDYWNQNITFSYKVVKV